MPLRHNKKRNSILVYEFLVRRLSEKMMEGNKSAVTETLRMTKKYFGEGTPLHSELQLAKTIRENRGVSQSVARRILGQVFIGSKSLDRRTINIKKSNLIKEINYTFGQDFFSRYKIPDYRALASIQVFLDSTAVNNRLDENIERVKIEEALICYMTNKQETTPVSIAPEHDHLTYKFALKKFDEKYASHLSSDQKALMEKYVAGLFSGDFKEFKRAAQDDQRKIYKTISTARSMNECKEDKVLLERLNEAASRLKSLQASPDESFVEEMMLYHALNEEIGSDE